MIEYELGLLLIYFVCTFSGGVMKRAKRAAWMSAAAALSLTAAFPALACTSMGVGKDASADGSVMVTHSCDGWYDHRVQIVKGGKHAAGEMVEIFNDPCFETKKEAEKVGEIPQAEETYTYFNVAYPFMNEKQVMIGEHTWGGRDEVSNPQGMMVIANLEMLGLQRGASAREVIQVMGEMAEKYGYCDGGECLIVGDANECWIFEIVGGGLLWQPDSGKPGAHWAARRLADDEVFVGANRSRLGVIDFNDPDNYMWSTDITLMPQENGWWSEGEEFDYTKIFDPTPYSGPFGSSRREWRVFSLIAPSKEAELGIKDKSQPYPFSIKPDKKLTLQDLTDIYQDHYEGTEYDQAAGLAGGPFHDPHVWSATTDQKPDYAAEGGHAWERIIAVDRCSYSFISQSRSWLPDAVGGVLWYGADSPDTTVHVPIYCGVTEIPEEWTVGNRKAFDRDCAWWAFNFVNNWAQLRWDAMYAEIREKVDSYEDRFFAEQAEIDAEAAKLYEQNPEAAISYLTKYTGDTMDEVNDGWWDFAWHLVGKYYDGMCLDEDGNSTTLGYPKEWLEAVGYAKTSVDDYAKTQGTPEAEAAAELADETIKNALLSHAPEGSAETAKAQETEAEKQETEAAAETETTAEPSEKSGNGMMSAVIAALVGLVVGGAGVSLTKKKKEEQ